MNVLIVRKKKREAFKNKASRITLRIETETCNRQNKECAHTVPTENSVIVPHADHQAIFLQHSTHRLTGFTKG